MENRPEYVGIWLGCTKVGVLPALINSNLQGNPLIHSIKSASAQGLIYGTELSKAVCDVADNLSTLVLFHSADAVRSNRQSVVLVGAGVGSSPSKTHQEASNAQRPKSLDFDIEITKCSPDPPHKQLTDKLKFTDKLLYIYTSGTTGLPKAAVIKHSR